MNSYDRLLLENKAWAQEKLADDPKYFSRLLSIQTPEFLWIGCSDSRVPANEITGTEPGEIFVHRNVANIVNHTDVNMLAVLDYAVNHLKVKHVIVCGHYGCGGIKAALSKKDYNYILNLWLRQVKDTYFENRDEIEAIAGEEKQCDRLVELNVQAQVEHLARTSIIQRAWKSDQRPDLHGWVYGLNNGIIKTICEKKAGSELDSVYTFDNF